LLDDTKNAALIEKLNFKNKNFCESNEDIKRVRPAHKVGRKYL
jgi:hypothetical protein